LSITRAAYAALPHIRNYTEVDLQEIVPLGFRCKDDENHVRELVAGMDMFACQFAGLLSGPPARGWRVFRPVFIPAEAELQP
jgi:hypothetical protein